MSLTHKSQSALEYMMTYGWAILIIVIVAGVLYSFGIFNPSSSASTTITGFSGLGVTQAACIQGGALQLQTGNALGYTVNITKLNTTGSSGQVVSIPTTIIISPSQSQSAFIPNACTSTTGASYSDQVTITYTEPGQVFSGPYFSDGKVSGKSVTSTPNLAAYVTGNGFITLSNYNIVATNSYTWSFWFYPTVWPAGNNGILGQSSTGSGNPYMIEQNNATCSQRLQFSDSGGGGGHTTYACVSLNSWQYVVGEYNYSTGYMSLYINGLLVNTSGPSITSRSASPFYFGHFFAGNYSGKLLGIQIYNVTLSSSKISRLYAEGLGGSPISNVNLMGWWPLTGNANDYSGNGNNGVPTNVQWVSP